MLYSVKYKKPGSLFFSSLKNVKGDGVCEGAQSRFFILSDETRIELPCSCQFIFSSQRFLVIKNMLDQQAGQTIPVKS
jgi:hypothetical protein